MSKKAKKNRKVDVADTIKDLLVAITADLKTVDTIAVDEISGRLKAYKVLLTKGKKGAFNPEDAHAISGLMSQAVGEYMYHNMNAEEYREFMEELIEDVENVDDDGNEVPSRLNYRRKGNADDVMVTFLRKFNDYLDANDFAKNPNFMMFTKLTDKFKLKKLCVFPRVETQNHLYAEWEKFARNR